MGFDNGKCGKYFGHIKRRYMPLGDRIMLIEASFANPPLSCLSLVRIPVAVAEVIKTTTCLAWERRGEKESAFGT